MIQMVIFLLSVRSAEAGGGYVPSLAKRAVVKKPLFRLHQFSPYLCFSLGG